MPIPYSQPVFNSAGSDHSVKKEASEGEASKISPRGGDKTVRKRAADYVT